MAATSESAIDFCDQLNARLDLDHEAWSAFAARVFGANPYRKNTSASEPSHLPQLAALQAQAAIDTFRLGGPFRFPRRGRAALASRFPVRF